MRDVLRQAKREQPGTRYHMTGRSAIDADTARYQAVDLARFIPLVCGIITLLLFLFVRRWRNILLARRRGHYIPMVGRILRVALWLAVAAP